MFRRPAANLPAGQSAGRFPGVAPRTYPSALRPFGQEGLPFSRPLETQETALRRLAFFALLAFVFVMPWENAIRVAGMGTVGRVVGLVAFGVLLLAALAGEKLRAPSLPHLLMSLFILWGAISYFWSMSPSSTLERLSSWIQMLVSVFLIWVLAPRRDQVLRILQAYLLGTVVSAGATVHSYVSGQSLYYGRYAGANFDPNDLGLLFALSIPMSLYLAGVEWQGWRVLLYRLHLLLILSAIALTGSRGALLASLAALLFIPLASRRLPARHKAAGLLIGMLAIAAAGILAPDTVWKRLSGIGVEMRHGSWSSRLMVWRGGWELFHGHPFLGVGAGSFHVGVQRTLQLPYVAHNTFLSVLVETGVVGLMLFLLILLSLVLAALPLPPLERGLPLALLLTWAVGVSALTWENRKPTWFLFGLLAAWAAQSGLLSRDGLRTQRAFVA